LIRGKWRGTQILAPQIQRTILQFPSWDPPQNEGDTSQLPTSLHWKRRPSFPQFWTQIHLGIFHPRRRSEEGVELNDSDKPVFLTFLGSVADSLNLLYSGYWVRVEVIWLAVDYKEDVSERLY